MKEKSVRKSVTLKEEAVYGNKLRCMTWSGFSGSAVLAIANTACVRE